MAQGWATKLDKGYHRLAAKARRWINRPESGRIVKAIKSDYEPEYVTTGLTPSKLTRLLQSFDAGDLAAGLWLATEIEGKDGHIYSVANTRRLALTGLPWRIVSAADHDDITDRRQADEAADYCREVLSSIEGFRKVLAHLAKGVGHNIAVAELVWEGDKLIDIAAVNHDRLRFELDDGSPHLRVRTAQADRKGIALDPYKWIVHTPHQVTDSPMMGGLLRITALGYLLKAYALKDWAIFMEVFGMPLRTARYEPSATEAEKRELIKMLRSLGTDAVGVFSKAVEIEFHEGGNVKGETPYERMYKVVNSELSKAWLGQTLTTEQGEVGSQALGRVHDKVRGDLLEADMTEEGETLRRDLLRPLVEGRFGEDCPVPYFEREIPEPRDETNLVSNCVRLVNELGMPIDRQWLAGEARVKLADKDEDALQPTQRALPALPLKDSTRIAAAERDPVLDEMDLLDRWAAEARGDAIVGLEVFAKQVDAWLYEAQTQSQTLAEFGEQLVSRASAMTDRRETIGRLAGPLGDLLLAGHLLGQWSIDRTINERQSGSDRLRLALNDHVFNLSFDEAVEALRGRVLMPRDAFDQLDREARSRAFAVAGIADLRLLADVYDAVQAAVKEGQTLHDFRRALPQMMERRGWSGDRPWHADLVLRQQSMMAFTSGRFRQMSDNGISHWRYSSLLDGRVRPEHAALDGKIFEMSDRRYYPPWEFNCRCIAEPIFASELPGLRVTDSADLVGRQFGSDESGRPLYYPADGGRFQWDPAAFAQVERPDPATLPPGFDELTGAFLN